jgi:ribose transport system substrate-binding protein
MMMRRFRLLRGHGRVLLLVAAWTTLATTLVACGSSDSSQSSSAATTADAACKAPSFRPPAGSQAALALLPTAQREQFLGYSGRLFKSAWTSWKPTHPAPYKIGIALGPLFNPTQHVLLASLQSELKSVPGVGRVITKVPNDLAIAQQIQQYQSLVQQHVDLIVLEPIAPKPFVSAIDAAARKGIPTLTIAGAVPTANAIDVGQNTVADAAALATRLVKVMGGKGSVLDVEGIPGYGYSDDSLTGYHAVFEGCPDIKVVGKVVGQYSPPVAKAQTLQFLSTNPAKVTGVTTPGSMWAPARDAFKQVGRPIPPIIDPSASVASLVYWRDHSAEYQGVASAGVVTWLAQGIRITVARMLHGDGPLVSSILLKPRVLTAADLDAVIPAGAKADSTAPSEAPPGSPGEPTDQSFAPWFKSGAASGK